MPFLPADHPIPAGLEHPRFRLRPITVNDVVRDYDAVMSSAEHLRSHFPLWGWPSADMTLESDLVDLGWHQREALLRRSFNYAVMRPDEQRLPGCVYVDPPEKEGADADVSFWVRRATSSRARPAATRVRGRAACARAAARAAARPGP
jgi:hypothetical protein